MDECIRVTGKLTNSAGQKKHREGTFQKKFLKSHPIASTYYWFKCWQIIDRPVPPPERQITSTSSSTFIFIITTLHYQPEAAPGWDERLQNMSGGVGDKKESKKERRKAGGGETKEKHTAGKRTNTGGVVFYPPPTPPTNRSRRMRRKRPSGLNLERCAVKRH